MDADFIWLVVTTAVLFVSAQILQSSHARVVTMAAYAVIGLFVGRRLFELVVYLFGAQATGASRPLAWDTLLSWPSLGVLVAQYVIAVVVLALMYRYNEKIIAWLVILVIGSWGLANLLI